MIRIVIVGTGDIAVKRHIPGILMAQDAKLHGFYNRSPKKARLLSEKYNAIFYSSWDEVIRDPAVDAVLISTPPDSHARLACEALSAGKHVLLEKPMALSMDEAVRIREAAEKSSAVFMMLHVQRFYKPHVMAKRLLESGEIGRLLAVRSFLCNADRTLLIGETMPDWHSALSNIGIHRIDLMRYFVGAEATGVFCRLQKQLGEPVGYTESCDEHAACILEYDNNVTGIMLASRTSYHGEDRMTQLIGTGGMIAAYYGGHDLVIEKADGEHRTYDFADSHPQDRLEITDIHEVFCRTIENGLPSPVNAEDGAESVRILEGMYKSNREQRWINLSRFPGGV